MVAIASVGLPLVVCGWLLRVVIVCTRRRRIQQPSGGKPVHTMAVLGSGGHTAEMLSLLRTLDGATYSPREYVIAQTDHTSAQRIEAFEAQRSGATTPPYRLLWLPRSREVGQSYSSSVLTTLHALVHAVALVFRSRPSLLLCNGPGTCVPVCAAAFALRLLGIQYTTIIYVESIARVQSLSLSGRIMIHFVDHFLVQWPQLASKYPRARYIGRLC
jgi:beta-1,4-N-acetylglucosaminyltransferase